GRPARVAVDGRSDIYSLGLLLYEALGGTRPPQGASPLQLPRLNPQVSVGLADLIRKCLAADPGGRYPDAAALAADLRRHLNDLPLRGVANRSLTERWRKWRRRRPHALAQTGMVFAVLGVALVAGLLTLAYVQQHRAHAGQRLDEAEKALADGRQRLKNRELAEAVRTLTRGLSLAEDTSGNRDLRRDLEGQLRLAKRAQAADDLHNLVDRIRFLYGAESPAAGGRALETRCRAVWEERQRILDLFGVELEPAIEQRIRT